MSATVRNLGGGGGKAQGYIIPASDSVSISGAAGTTATVNLTVIGDGALSVSSSDSSVATASISNNVVTLTGLTSGTAVITLTMAESSTYLGTTATISAVIDVFTPIVGSTYKLGSGAHTSGTADLECVVLDIIGTNAICQSKGIYGAAWPGISELTSIKSTYFGDLASAVSGLYLPRGNTDGSETTTTPTDVYVYDGSSFVNTYSSDVKTILTTAANNYSSYGASYSYSWLGTPYNSSRDWCVYKSGVIDNIVSTNSQVIAPTFILDLTKVKLYGDLIVDINADPAPTVVTFANGTDAQIKAMLDGYYAGIITWEQMGWNVGDTRLIHFNSMTAPKPWQSKTWSAQDITSTIIGHNQNILATPVNGHTKACITVQVRECLNNSSAGYGQMNDSDSGGHIGVIDHYQYANAPFTKWSELYIRSYMNSTLLDAIPSGDFKSAIKPSKHYRHIDNTTTTAEQVTDTLFLPSIPEYVGTSAVNQYTPTSPTEGTQFPYYETASNRIKYGNNAGSSNGVAQFYWTGSATTYFSTYTGAGWLTVNTAGDGSVMEQFYGMGLAPAWVM